MLPSHLALTVSRPGHVSATSLHRPGHCSATTANRGFAKSAAIPRHHGFANRDPSAPTRLLLGTVPSRRLLGTVAPSCELADWPSQWTVLRGGGSA